MQDKLFKDEPTKRTRKRDYLFEALQDVCGIWKVSKLDRGRLNKAIDALKEKGIENDPSGAREIRERARRYKAEWKDVEFTATALASNWDRFGPQPKRSLPGQPGGKEADELNKAAKLAVQKERFLKWWGKQPEQEQKDLQRRAFLGMDAATRAKIPPNAMDPLAYRSWANQLFTLWVGRGCPEQ